MLVPPSRQSFFLFGPRGVGKTAWLRERFADAPFFDLLDADTYTRLLGNTTSTGFRRKRLVSVRADRLPSLPRPADQPAFVGKEV
jgi:hypothetical protein